MNAYCHPFNENLPATSASRSLPGVCTFVRVQSLSGTVQISINNGDWVRVRTGFYFEAPPGLLINTCSFRAVGGGSVEAVYGRGSMGGGAGGGIGGMLSGSGAPSSPPDDAAAGAAYYDYTNGALYAWNTSTQAWDALIV